MRGFRTRGLALILLAGIGAGSEAIAEAAIAPYQNDFASSASDFTLSTAGGGWTLDTSGSGTLGHSNTNSNSATLFSAGLELSNLGGPAATASDFEISGAYSASALVGTFDYLGVVGLGSNSAFSSGADSFYMLRHLKNAQLELYRVSGGNSVKLANVFAETISLNTAYALTLTGTYVDTNADAVNDALDLTAELAKGSSTYGFTYRDATPLAGSYFGMRDQNANNNATVTMAWDSISVTLVPEPAGLATVVLLIGGLLRRHRCVS